MTETTRSDSLLRGMRPDIAKRLIASFAKRFKQPHLYFAQHAAFPMAFTSDLLYRLWVNFRRDTKGEMLNIPWIAVADMLLSPLCNEVGHELYEMDVTVRTELLNALKANPDFAQRRINELSDFLLDYIQQQLNSNDPDTRDFAQAQRWTALAYVRPGKAAHELVAALRKVDPNDKAELLRLASLIEIFAEPLADFAPLLTYSRGIGYWVRGDQERAVTEFNNMGSREVQGIPLPIPEEARDQVDTQVCPNCGSFMPSWAKFCDKCSSSLPTLQVQAESINTKFVSPYLFPRLLLRY